MLSVLCRLPSPAQLFMPLKAPTCSRGKSVSWTASESNVAFFQIRRDLLGSRHLLVAQSLNNLGSLLMASGQYTRAEPMLRNALSVREQALGTDHPEASLLTALVWYGVDLRLDELGIGQGSIVSCKLFKTLVEDTR